MMKPYSRRLSYILLSLLCLGLVACKSNYKIESPTRNSVNTNPPTFKISYSKKPKALPRITLNGLAVESFFTAGDSYATADGNQFKSYFLEGYNTFHVNPPTGPIQKFIYDTKGPQIVILGSEINGNTASIKGKAVDELGVDKLSVNGTDISVNKDQTFSIDVPVPANDVYTYQAEDSLGHKSTTLYASLGLLYSPSLTAKVTQKGLDVATRELVNAVNGMDLNDKVAGTELYNKTSKGAFGETYGPSGFIRTIKMSVRKMDMDLKDGNRIALDGDVSLLYAALTLRSYNGLLPPTDINLGATVGDVTFSADIDLGVKDQRPTVKLENFTFNLGGIQLDGVSDLGNNIISGMSTGLLNVLNGVVNNLVQKILNDAIPGMLSKVLQDAYTMRITDAKASHDLSMVAKIAAIATTEDQLYAALSGGVVPGTPDLDIPQPYVGALYTDAPLTEAQLGEGDMAVSINTNVINQTLASAYSVGLNHMNITGTNLQFGLPRDDSLGGEQVNQRILIDSKAPATVEISAANGATTIRMNVHGMQIASESKKNGVYSSDIGVRVDAHIPISIGVADDKTLAVSFPAPPEVIITGLRLGQGSWLTQGVNELANKVIADSFGLVVKQLVKPIANLKMPALKCLAFDVKNIAAIGGQQSHLNISGSLIKTSDACDVKIIDPPKVAYGRGLGTALSCGDGKVADGGLCYSACKEGYNGVGPVCWKKDASYSRGVGSIPTTCGANEELEAGLCYASCKAGYHGVGPVCWSDQPLSYGRGIGTIPSNIWTGECPAGKENQAGLCYTPCKEGYNPGGPVCHLQSASYGRGVGKAPSQCGAGEENNAGLCYKTCNSGYHGVGAICWTDAAVSYGRGVGTLANTCPQGFSKQGLLCHKDCKEGYVAKGAVCWPE